MSTTTLPSITAAEALWRKEPGALGRVALSMLERSAVIGGALWLAGEREKLLRYTLAATVAVEAIVLWQVKRQLNADAIAPPSPAPTTIEELGAAQKAMAYSLLKDKWTTPEVFNTYLTLSRRRLPVLLPDDFTDTDWGRQWLETTLAQAAAESNVAATDPGFRQSTIPFLNDVWAALKSTTIQTCGLSPALCQSIADRQKV